VKTPSVPLVRRLAWALLLAQALSGCATAVSVYDRERLVDPIMSFRADAKKDARLNKSFEAREGSTGGIGGAGGGCACSN